MLNFQSIRSLAVLVCFIQVAHSLLIVDNNLHHAIKCEGSTLSISCLDTERMRIKYANYGRIDGNTCYRPGFVTKQNCHSRVSTSQVIKRCEGAVACSIPATNTVFGDPCYGTHKYLEVKFICEKVENKMHQAIRCEGFTLSIGCLDTERIRIKYANYGRTNGETCYRSGVVTDQNCYSQVKSNIQVKKRCEGRVACTIPATNAVFGDPCYGTHKYLEVRHICEKVDPCSFKPCANGGTCSVSGTGFNCFCKPGFSGKDCRTVYMGCYADGEDGALSDLFAKTDSMTIELCIQLCRDNGNYYAGLQDGTSCLCGNGDYDKYGISDNCGMSCRGNNQQICGGEMTNSVYKVGASTPIDANCAQKDLFRCEYVQNVKEMCGYVSIQQQCPHLCGLCHDLH